MLSSRVFWRVFALFVVTASAFVLAGAGIGGLPSVAAPVGEWTSWCWRFAIVFVGITAVGFWVARWVVRRVAIPLDTVILAAERLGTADAPLELPSDLQAYPERLTTSFRAMSQRVTVRITELEQWRESLDQNNQQLAIVLEAMVEGVIAVDARERILLANMAAIRLLDLKPQGLTGRALWEAVRLPKVQELVRQTLAGGEQQRIEIEVPRTHSTLAAVMSRLPGEPSSGAVIVLHDVTDLRRLENLRREFVSNVSHELKTPLAAISAYAETLLDGALEDPEINRGFVSRIGEQADRLHTLILELLELGRMESDEHAFELKAIEIGAVLRECVDEHQDVAKSKNLRLEAEVSAGSVWGMADLEGLRTIADNLVDNAINYTPAGGRISVRWRREGDWIVFEVEDTGVGIVKENQARIFERFYRVDRARSREVGGTGLGLSIVKHMCQVFGGQIKVTSQLGKGSTFTVRLRAAEPVARGVGL
jgi:two-component system, OmpR family, phosphate regulon sensor histidine kinase PhoR